MLRTGQLIAVALIASSLAACAPAVPELPLAELVEVARPTEATSLIWRREPASLRALGRGWSVDVGQAVVGFWALGRTAEVHLFLLRREAYRLRFEAMPPAGLAAQGVTLRVNGNALPLTLMLVQGWHEYELTLPAESLRLGYNRLEFSFADPVRPADLHPGNGDQRPLAARFRYLRLLPTGAAVDRDPGPNPELLAAELAAAGVHAAAAVAEPEPEPAAPAEPEPEPAAPAESAATDVGPATAAGWRPTVETPAGDSVPALRMPADSMLEIALRLPAGARFVARPEALLSPRPEPAPAEGSGAPHAGGSEPTGGQDSLPANLGRAPRVLVRAAGEAAGDTAASGQLSGQGAAPGAATGPEVHWQVELIDEGGATHPLADSERWFRPRAVDVSLDRWAGTTVLLRLRVWGTGEVLWHEAGFVGEIDRAQFDLPALPVPEVSGRLGKPDVVVILLDAARADAFSTYRGATATPHVDALAADGTRFERAYAAAPWTGQSVYSIFTGRYPEAHGVAAWKDQLPEQIHSLFQHMYAAGYHTYLWTEHPVYRGTRSLRYDVDTIVDLKPRDREHRRELLPRAVDMFRAGQPTFAFIHLVPPHAPYDAPAPYAGSLSGWYQGDFPIDPASLELISEGVGQRSPTAEDVRYVWSRYLENVRYADELVGRIVQTLRRAGRYDDALVVLLSDHGESFWEHGHFLHTWPLYEELLHVPLVIKWPARRPGFARAIDEPVSLVDLAPTLMDAIGVDAEGFGLQGLSLLPVAYDEFRPERDIYASTVGVSLRTRDEAPAKPMASLRHGRYKVIWDEVSGRVEVYDLERDPGEKNELSARRPLLAQLLLQRLRLQRAANLLLLGGLEVIEAQGELDPEIAERLRALGYLR